MGMSKKSRAEAGLQARMTLYVTLVVIAVSAGIMALNASLFRKEIEKGIQTIQYQVVTLMTTNGQAPFITVFMYLDEVPEGQTRDDLAMIIEAMLNQRIQGVKNEVVAGGDREARTLRGILGRAVHQVAEEAAAR